MIDVQVGRSPGGRRRFPVAFRVEFLRTWDAQVELGGKTRLLREYGLADCTVRRWVAARDAGEFESSMLIAAGRSKNSVNNQDRAELARLRRENAALQAKVKQAEAAQEILGKAFEILDGIAKASTESDPAIPLSLMSAAEYTSWLRQLRLS